MQARFSFSLALRRLVGQGSFGERIFVHAWTRTLQLREEETLMPALVW